MKLKSKILIIANSKGEEISVSKKVIALDLNGERSDIKLKDIFSCLEFDSGEIYGNSLLSYYKVNQDGSLQVEGSKIQLVDEATGDLILVKAIEKPSINDDDDIPFAHVQKFAEFFKIAKPEEVFTNLEDSEKQIFISERTAKQSIPTKEASDASEIERKAEAELKASINPSYVMEKPEYISTQSYYLGLPNFKQYSKDKYDLFYGPDPEYPPCVLIKHGEWREEVTENNTEIIDKTDKTVVIKFKGINQSGKITLDIDSGDINITNLDGSED